MSSKGTVEQGMLHQACFKWLGIGDRVDMPRRESRDAAALDVRAAEFAEIFPGQTQLVGTGWAMRPPFGHAGFLLPRSGLGNKGLVLGNLVGLIDPDYRGEIKVSLWNRNAEGPAMEVMAGERIAQLIFLPFSRGEAVEVTHLDATDRADGGFGSTGEK